ncbi:GNAT family N-acetyltransferase [Candidatus Thorarchaeota archaeon]|nr:MAG: GNAT family N-acetyltransferase [Candidatus Thorarchaeota archaeon]
MNEVMRPLTAEDEQDVVEIGRQVWSGHDYVPSTFRAWLNDDSSHPQAIEIDNKVVCFANLRIIDNGRTAWFEGLRTHPEWREQGLARRITEHLAQIAGQLDAERIRYTTASTNKASLKLAHHIGMNEQFRMQVSWFPLGDMESDSSTELEQVGADTVIQLLSDHPTLIPMNTIIYDWKVLEADSHGIRAAAESNRFWSEQGGRSSLSLGKQRNEDEGVLWCFTIYALEDDAFRQHLEFHIGHGKKRGYPNGMATYQPKFASLFSERISEKELDRSRGLVFLEKQL